MSLKMLRSGQVYIGDGHLWGSGIDSYEWSSRASRADIHSSHYLGFNASGVVPSGNNNRHLGFPLRCLARQ